jgi:TPR repeat protein
MKSILTILFSVLFILPLLSEAAEQGNIELLSEAAEQGNIELLSEAAEQGNIDAKYKLAMIYREKLGMPWRGASLIEEAAKKGHPGAQYEYGIMHQSSELEFNREKALYWLQEAKKNGNEDASKVLSDMLA